MHHHAFKVKWLVKLDFSHQQTLGITKIALRPPAWMGNCWHATPLHVTVHVAKVMSAVSGTRCRSNMYVPKIFTIDSPGRTRWRQFSGVLRGAFKKSVRLPKYLWSRHLRRVNSEWSTRAKRGRWACFPRLRRDATIIMQLASRVARMLSRASQSKSYIQFPPPFRAYTPFHPRFSARNYRMTICSQRGSRMIAVGHFARLTRANLRILCKLKPRPSRATC